MPRVAQNHRQAGTYIPVTRGRLPDRVVFVVELGTAPALDEFVSSSRGAHVVWFEGLSLLTPAGVDGEFVAFVVWSGALVSSFPSNVGNEVVAFIVWSGALLSSFPFNIDGEVVASVAAVVDFGSAVRNSHTPI